MKERLLFLKELVCLIFVGLLLTCYTANGQAVQGVRTDIYNFSSAERAELADLIIDYVSPEILQQHCDYVNASGGEQQDIHSDFDFLPFHRVYLEHLEDWLIAQGHPEYVPLPSWDPSTPAPQEFRTAGPDNNGVDPDCGSTTCGNAPPASTGCSDVSSWNPNVDLPNYLSLPIQNGNNNDICDLNFSPTAPGNSDSNGLSRQIEVPWHNPVHVNMGGVMSNFRSPAVAAFWIWHAYVDDVWKSWEGNCSQSSTQPVDLYIKDNYFTVLSERDRGEEPDIDDGGMWKSPDIWVRRQADGLTNQTHQNPEYGQTNYIYVRVRNRGYQTSLGSEQLNLYWAKANTVLDWPDIWQGNETIGNPPVQLGNPVGVQTIGSTNAQGQTIVEFAWNPPNPEDYESFIDSPQHFCLLARIEANNDPMYDELNGGIGYNTKANNNIAWKNISIIDLEANSTPRPRGVLVYVGNTREHPLQVDFGFELPKVIKGNTIFDEARVIATLDDKVWQKWNEGGKMGRGIKIYNQAKHQISIGGDNAALTNIFFEPNELAQVHVGFEFIEEKRSGQKEFELDLVQRETNTQEVMGGETYQVITKGIDGFYAPQDRMETTYDPNPYGPITTTTNGNNEATYGITSLTPNPASHQVTINYILNNVNQAKILLLNQSGVVVNQYPINSNQTSINVNLSGLPNGLYYVIMMADGQTINNKNLVKE